MIDDVATDGYETPLKETSGVSDGVIACSEVDEVPPPTLGAEKSTCYSYI